MSRLSNNKPQKPLPLGEVLIEMNQIGNQMKVTAIDPASMIEVSFIAPKNSLRTHIKQLAVSKLSYVIRKRQNRA